MSILSNLVRNISGPVAQVASVIPNPIAQGVAVVSGQIAKDTARRKYKEQLQERQRLMETSFTRGGSIPTINANLAATTPVLGQQSSGGGFFDTI